jgi:hypothetical protein
MWECFFCVLLVIYTDDLHILYCVMQQQRFMILDKKSAKDYTIHGSLFSWIYGCIINQVDFNHCVVMCDNVVMI